MEYYSVSPMGTPSLHNNTTTTTTTNNNNNNVSSWAIIISGCTAEPARQDAWGNAEEMLEKCW